MSITQFMAALLAICALVIGWERGVIEHTRTELAAERAAHHQFIAEAQSTAASASAQARETERRREAAAQEIAHEADRFNAHRVDALAAGAAAADGLRERAEAVAARCDRSPEAASDPAAGPPAEEPGRALADVLGSLADLARLYAADAYEIGAAGTACDRIYDELTIGELP